MKTAYGENPIEIPWDRNSNFQSEVLKKRAIVEEGLESQIISMYAKGMSVRDIADHVQTLYGVAMSPTSISNITDNVMEDVDEWFRRTLESFYLEVYLDAVHFKVREDNRIVTKTTYVALGIINIGRKDVLGMWVGENEGAKFWMKVCNELKNRDIYDILIICIDGLKEFPEAIHTVFPETKIQLCIIHQIRNTIKYVSYKEQRESLKDLRGVWG